MTDSGLACLVMLARFHDLAAEPEQIRHEAGGEGRAFDEEALLLAARELGLRAKAATFRLDRLDRLPLLAIAADRNGGFFVLASVREAVADGGGAPEQRYLIHAPLAARPEALDQHAFRKRWNSRLTLLTSRASLAAELSRFDFSWFVPAIVKYRKLLGEILLASFILQLFALITPLFFQVVMDKVLVHQGFSTLTVIGSGLIMITLFESVLSWLRTYLFAHTSSRIDVELGARQFRHLLALPLAYFEARRVGDSVARVRELEHIRQFLAGSAFTLVLDRVLTDGIDLSLIDPAWLRRQIGVVLQENVLFARSVRENIALAAPGASLDAVMAPARLAGAHDFIMELPEGYDTAVGEHGSTLSGGQRQRIAIARALMTNPRILIFDEATSALDYESERIIQDNMRAICRGRSVLIIAHRLSAVKDADRILVMDRGELVEQGRHDELKALPDGIYAKLHAMQKG